MNKPNKMPAVRPSPFAFPPVRIKLWRPDAFVAQTYPPDGESKNWWRTTE